MRAAGRTGLLWLTIVGAGVAALAGSCDNGNDPAAPPSLASDLEWELAPRFGLDANGNGLTDLPNSADYVHGVEDGLATTITIAIAESRTAFERYRWEIGGQVTIEAETRLPEWTGALPEGTYAVSVRAVEPDGIAVPLTTDEEIHVDDTFVVALGGTLMSGGGAPEGSSVSPNVIYVGIGGSDSVGAGGTRLDVTWADSGESGPGTVTHFRFESVVPQGPAHHVETTAGDDTAEEHAIALRSTLGVAGLTALQLERRDRHSSITFVNLAASGATVANGVLGGDGRFGSQLDRLAELAGCGAPADNAPRCLRPPDLVLLSIDFEDVGMEAALLALVANNSDVLGAIDGVGIELADVRRAVATGDWSPLAATLGAVTAVTGGPMPPLSTSTHGGLASALDTMADRLIDEFDDPDVVLIAPPHPFEVGDGLCENAVERLTPLGMLDADEISFVDAQLIEPLYEVARTAATAHRWDLVIGDAEGHGVCLPPAFDVGNEVGRPYPPRLSDPTGAGVRWFLDPAEAAAIVGGFKSTEPPALGPNVHARRALAAAIARTID